VLIAWPAVSPVSGTINFSRTAPLAIARNIIPNQTAKALNSIAFRLHKKVL
jgi:hypothetical protein